jgi:hypothetical protein
MKKLFILFLIIISSAYAEVPEEIKSNKLKWVMLRNSHISKDEHRVISNKFNNKDNMYDAQIAFVDLNYDKKDEIVVKSFHEGSAFQAAYFFFEKKNNQWHQILTLYGGFILNNVRCHDCDDPKYSDKERMYYTITNWIRGGSMHTDQEVYVYKKNKYIQVNSQTIPLTVMHQKDFTKMLLELNDLPTNTLWN